MEKKLQINLFSCNHRAYRFPFTVKMVNEILNIKNHDKIKLAIHAQKSILDNWIHVFNKIKNELESKKIKIIIYVYPDENYINRVNTAQKTECKYSCKLDDDVLISRHVWDYMIDNLDKINNQNPIMLPILTNGIPSADLFIEDFLNKEDLKIAHSLLLNGRIEVNPWGLDYSSINAKIESMESWNGREYWDFVADADTKWDVNPVPWHYFNVRGVHPCRFSFEFNKFIAEKIFENKNKFFDKHEYKLEEYFSSYVTNNIFISTTDYWKYSLNSFEPDGWDEGQLSLRMLMDDTKALYVRNGFGIHMAYGMTNNGLLIERMYIDNI